ncbi:MAG TPA: FAD-binding protein [Devosia sp.]|nr:FAD-binding protein [Devosia sp.]
MLVAGAGAGGLTAAVLARAAGLSVIVAEKTPHIGGTAARSGGVIWVPGSPVAARGGVADPAGDAKTYLKDLMGPRFDEALVSAFLANGPKMVAALEAIGAVELVNPSQPDYRLAVPGASSSGGRSLASVPMDGKMLGDQLGLLRRPLPQMTLFGGMMLGGVDLQHFLKMTRSFTSASYVAKLILRYGFDMVFRGRSTRLTGGNALVGRLMKVARDSGVSFRLSSPIEALLVEGGRVAGVLVRHEGVATTIRARRGVILATGGVPAEQELVRRSVRRGPDGVTLSLMLETNAGDGVGLAVAHGATACREVSNPAVYTPVSLVPQKGGVVVTPHFVERTKPGFIAVNQAGRRFVNEANSYVEFGEAMIERAMRDGQPIAYLICDHTALRRYGMGPVRPAPMPFWRGMWRDYLISAPTIPALARLLGIDAAALLNTVGRVNEDAKGGRDTEFGKGENALNRFLGDRGCTNPNFGPIADGPFYAVRLHLGDYGTMMGVNTDAAARVLDAQGEPIIGLYAAGSDMAHAFRGAYPGGGTGLGPAMTFGYVAAQHILSGASATSRVD